MWLRMAAAADDDSAFARLKYATARFHTDHLMPAAMMLERQALAGSAILDSVDANVLGAV